MALLAHQLAYAYRRHLVLQGVDLTLQPGEVVALLGANGAGKSTLLRLLLGLLAPDGGSVMLEDRPLDTWPRREVARRLAYVPQVHAAPFPYAVEEVVLLGRLPAGGLFLPPTAVDRQIVAAALQHLSIAHLAARPYNELSGGERQLVLIARALAQEARLLIMDEPATGLDYGHQMRLLAQLRRLADEGYGVLFSTHHPEHTLLAADRVLLLRDGRIEAAGPPQQIINAAALQRLYGVEVDAIHDPAGRCCAFRPTDLSATTVPR